MGTHGQPLRKPYSIACAPEVSRRDGHIELLVQVDSTGSPGPHLANLRKGSLVDLEGPFGSFRFPQRPAEHRFLFIGGGTGIAPIRAMLWHALLTRPRDRLGVLYSARAPQEFAYHDELQRLAKAGRIELRQTVTRHKDACWTGNRGRINADQIASLLHSPATLCFVCGPPALVRDAPQWLRQLGIAESRVSVEEWKNGTAA